MRALWHLMRWMGRVTLWLVYWPVGLWRSIHRSHEKSGTLQ